MRFTIGQASETGARASNQDRMGYCFSRESLLMVVADGMGGHLRGEVAAQLSMQAAAAAFQRAARPRLQDPAGFLGEAFRAGHRELHRYRELHALPECPHTTIVACVIQDDTAWWAHAGDSRLYLMRSGKPATRTRDHSKVEHLLSLGLITGEQARTHPELNMVLNCLGSSLDPAVDLSAATALLPGDVVLLCSDGFWSGVDEGAMAKALLQEPLAAAVPTLVREAVARNGASADNATALALRWDGDCGEDLDASSPPGLAEGAFTTTIGSGPHDEPA